MRKGASTAGPALLSGDRTSTAMRWVIGIMIFFSLLFAAAALGLGSAAGGLRAGNKLTVQITAADPTRREREATSALAVLERLPAIASASRVSAQEMERLLEPWLGKSSLDAELPIPVMIDVELREGADVESIRQRVRAAAPSARIDDHALWLAPLGNLIDSLKWLAAFLVALTAGATAASVVLAARAGLDTHRDTIEILHLTGATDAQIARLFRRRIARDSAIGALAGTGTALLVLWLIGDRVAALGSELVGAVSLEPTAWALLGLLPVAGVLLAMLVARAAILRALVRL